MQSNRRNSGLASFNTGHSMARCGRQPLALAISALLLTGAVQVQAQMFPAEFELSSLDGSNGFKIDGEAAGDFFGVSVSSAADINGDGIDDLLVGAPLGDTKSHQRAGLTYIIFGRKTAFNSPFQLSSLDGTNGLKIEGEFTDDRSGTSVSGAGDINADGRDDLIIGAYLADSNGISSGRSYVLYGFEKGLTSPLSLTELEDAIGSKLDGFMDDFSGFSASGAGDINGDGVSDLIIGAPSAGPNCIRDCGRSYLVFGAQSGLNTPLQLPKLDGVNGIKIDGESWLDESGKSVSDAGDINGDGIDDLIIGARFSNANSYDSGRSYVVFGQTGVVASPLRLITLDGTKGFKIDGELMGGESGASVSSAGDINGDAIDDMVIGAPRAGLNGTAGRSYIVFGSKNEFVSPVQLSKLDGTNGFIIDGVAANDFSGSSVSSAGDINGDGNDDFIIGAPGSIVSLFPGHSYVVFGRATGFSSLLQLATLDGRNGFSINGESTNDRLGASVHGAGDINGDGIDDVLIGAPRADPNGSDSGRSYVIFGRNTELVFADSFENGS